MKDIVNTNPYEYYATTNVLIALTEANYETRTTTLNFTVKYSTTNAQEDYVTAQINDIVPKLISSSKTTLDKELVFLE